MKLDMTTGMEAFVNDYIGTACEDFQQTIRDEGKDIGVFPDELPEETLDRLTADAKAFWYRNGAYILARAENNDRGEWNIAQRAATAFWLNRNGHGSGFWDYEKLWGPYTDRFTKDSEWFGTCDLYLGDDNKVYAM